MRRPHNSSSLWPNDQWLHSLSTNVLRSRRAQGAEDVADTLPLRLNRSNLSRKLSKVVAVSQPPLTH